jgi:hypothetical protein
VIYREIGEIFPEEYADLKRFAKAQWIIK